MPSPEIVNYYETDLYKKDLERAKIWGENNFFVKGRHQRPKRPHGPAGSASVLWLLHR